MKIGAAAVVALSGITYSSAFIGPQFARKTTTIQPTRVNLQVDGDNSPGWVGPAATAIATLTVASQVSGATVDVMNPPSLPAIEISNGEKFPTVLGVHISFLT